jgi:hypothetical protein
MAVRTDANGDYFSITSGLPVMSGAFTLALWAYISADRNDYSIPWKFEGINGNPNLSTDATGTAWVIASDSAESSAYSVATGEWHHLVWVHRSNTDNELWVDGVLRIDAFSMSTTGGTLTALRLGRYDATYWFNGRLFDAKFWTAALTAAEVVQEVYAIHPVSTASLYGWWPLFPGSGERVRDYSGNGHNWTESGSITDEDPPPVGWGTQTLTILRPATATAYTLSAAQATFSETGIAVNLLRALKLSATAATFSETGNAVNLVHGYPLTAATATFTETGVAANLLQGHKISAATATFAETGIAANLLRGLKVSAAPAAFSETGITANLRQALKLTAERATFSETGNAAGLLLALKLTAEQATFTETGNAANLLVAYRLATEVCTYAVTGFESTLTYTPVGAYTLTASVGSFTETGIAANLRQALNLTAGQATFSETGNAAGLLLALKLIAEQATFTETGNAANLLAAHQLATEVCTYAVTGFESTLTYTSVGAYTLTASVGSFTESGNAAGLRQALKLTAGQATLTYTGQPAGIGRGLFITTACEAVEIDGRAVNLLFDRLIGAGAAAYVLAGLPTLIYFGSLPQDTVYFDQSITRTPISAIEISRIPLFAVALARTMETARNVELSSVFGATIERMLEIDLEF